jgi:hypothetical protein
MSVKYIAVIFLSVSLLKPPFSGFRSETAIWTQKRFKKSVGTSRKPWTYQFFKAETAGVVIEACVK